MHRVEAHWNSKVSKIRFDNGKDLNKNVQKWCRQKRIVLHSTTLYIPRLNGKAESLNRTLLDKVHALLFDSNFNNKKKCEDNFIFVSLYIY